MAATSPSSTAALEERIVHLEASAQLVLGSDSGPHVAADLQSLGMLGCALQRVPSEYYSWPLARRAATLRTTTPQLCKTIVFENVHPQRGSTAALGDAPHLAVVLQYITRVDMDALERFLRTGGSGYVKLRAAQGVAELTGFQFNAVTVFGSKLRMPIIVAKPITQLAAPASIWIGGGEVDVKLRVFVHQLLTVASKVAAVAVVDCVLKRTEEDAED